MPPESAWAICSIDVIGRRANLDSIGRFLITFPLPHCVGVDVFVGHGAPDRLVNLNTHASKPDHLARPSKWIIRDWPFKHDAFCYFYPSETVSSWKGNLSKSSNFPTNTRRDKHTGDHNRLTKRLCHEFCSVVNISSALQTRGKRKFVSPPSSTYATGFIVFRGAIKRHINSTVQPQRTTSNGGETGAKQQYVYTTVRVWCVCCSVPSRPIPSGDL